MDPTPETAAALARVAQRLRELRMKRDLTLVELASVTGISVSTLSRLESGQRKPNLELLLPLSAALGVSLDRIVEAPRFADPRVSVPAQRVHGRLIQPLTRAEGALQAFKISIPATQSRPDPRVHEGFEWIYVLSGTLRLQVDGRDIELGAGEVAEFDTRLPHWFGSTGSAPVEILSLFGKQGERMHVRALDEAE
ncbi:helix-turn-helix domain-containing protein [Mycetocola spongiae]|uniref:helix-turn-helix domain-containing protein n=1 Tax=Mycetocola spongiae TaxID=2859226 RepID=UPI001CF3DD97|nr:XRE family transcriptional regulator [Mycetocola spongiae]UCR90197.1 XRE family transcriptional regulator [Mycetocola spongiae]